MPTKRRLHLVPNSMRDCPRCGGLLIIRLGAQGEYVSCANHPRCRFRGMTLQEVRWMRNAIVKRAMLKAGWQKNLED